MQGCESVRIVILCSYDSAGGRFEGLKKIVRLLSTMIVDIEDYMDDF